MNRIFRVAMVLCLLFCCVAAANAAPGTVEEIRINGLFRMTRAGFLHALGVSVGDAYDVELLRLKYREIWELKLFQDMSFHIESAPDGGVALIIVVVERPVLSSVEYKENKSLNRTEIEDALSEKEVRLDLGRPIDDEDLAETAAVIRDLLAQKGHTDPTVDYTLEDVTETSRAVTFRIVPGPKTRIRKIIFRENERFSSRTLRKQLELTDVYRWYWPWSKKTLYHPLKWDQDSGRIRDLYKAFGFLDVDLRAPIVEYRKPKKKPPNPVVVEVPPIYRVALLDVERKLSRENLSARKRRKLRARRTRLQTRSEKALRKAELKASGGGKQWATLTVDVNEGQQYKLGEVKISGNTVFTDEQLRGNVFMREGSILSETQIDLTVNSITRRYEDRGHLYASITRRIDRREGDEAIADIEVQILEDEPYIVERIEFSGNTSTQDKVLRREVLLSEGDLFHRTKLDFSGRKLNQLGYWVVQEEPLIVPVETQAGSSLADETDEKKAVNITFSGEEQGRNEIQVGGGYSGVDGAFFSGVYSTRNFLGRGQVLSAAVQLGGRTNSYSLSFTEPWFMHRPITFGVSLFKRDVDFGNQFKSSSQGLGLILGRRLGRFGSLTFNYRFEDVSSTSIVPGATTGGSLTSSATNQISSLTPQFLYNTVNNPYRPTRGQRLGVTLQLAGAALGGDTSYYKPLIQYTGYKKPRRTRGFFSLNAELGFVSSWADGSPRNSATINEIPRFQRFWLGGDTKGPRVFETRSITPLRYVTLEPLDPSLPADPVSNPQVIGEVLGDPRNHELTEFPNAFPIPIEVGGNRYYLFQTEYVWPLNEQTDLAFFVDAGDSLFDDDTLGFDTLRMSAGVELRFYLPVFPVPLRLIYGIPIRELDSDRSGNFQFSIGRSF